MKQLISKYIEENYSDSVKELGIVKAHIIYSNCDTFEDELSYVRASVLEYLEEDLLLHKGYSIGVLAELNLTIAYVLDGIVEECANKILKNLNNL